MLRIVLLRFCLFTLKSQGPSVSKCASSQECSKNCLPASTGVKGQLQVQYRSFLMKMPGFADMSEGTLKLDSIPKALDPIPTIHVSFPAKITTVLPKTQAIRLTSFATAMHKLRFLTLQESFSVHVPMTLWAHAPQIPDVQTSAVAELRFLGLWVTMCPTEPQHCKVSKPCTWQAELSFQKV